MHSQKADEKEKANMADNQVAFRKLNAKLKKMIDELDQIAVERGMDKHTFQTNQVYQFYCECSDENCRERIPMRFDTYEKAHEEDDTFTILRGHEVPVIEEIVYTKSNYAVVKKHVKPKQSNEVFHETALNNAA